MKFYHVSREIFKSIAKFTPKIPEHMLNDENATIDRICVSNSIVNCLNGIYYEYNYGHKFFFSSLDNEEFDIPNMLLKVYEIEVNNEIVLSPREINQYVSDSIITQEYWIMEDIQPIKEYLIDIKSYKLDKHDIDTITEMDYRILSDGEVMTKLVKKIKLTFNKNNDRNELEAILDTIVLDYKFNKNIAIINTSAFPLLKKQYSKLFKQIFEGISYSIEFQS